MSKWVKNAVFDDIDGFINWLDDNYRNYIKSYISSNHIHHTWRPDHNTGGSTLQLHINMGNYHVNTNGWNDIAQHASLGKDGKIVLGRNITAIPVSAKYYNGTATWHPFAFEMIGNFDKGNDVLKGKQLEAAIKISRYFYKLGKGIIFHRECLIGGKPPKTCPGTGISKDWYMNLVRDSKFDVGNNVGYVKPSPPTQVGGTNSENVQSANLLQRGDKGSKVERLQKKLIKAGYKLPVYGADGSFGQETEDAVKDLQRKHNIKVDGLFGQDSSRVLEKELNKGGSNSSSSSEKGKRVESIYKGSEGLNFYSRPSWNKKYKVGTFKYGNGWTIIRKLKVDSSYQYEVKNSKGDVYYITASPKYVKVEGKSKPVSKPKKTIRQLAQEVIDGKHGQGHENRRKSLGMSKSEYDKVRDEVNRILGAKSSNPRKSISQMADEVIEGKHGQGHSNRRKSLGISQSEYDKVRKEVNKRL